MNIQEHLKKEQALLEQHGWLAHFIIDDNNTHTHGLMENLNHPDLQCTLPVHPHAIHAIFSVVIERIKKGEKFEAGKKYNEIIPNMEVLFINAIEANRSVLRIIFPDKDGKLEKKDMTKEFAQQYDNTGITLH